MWIRPRAKVKRGGERTPSNERYRALSVREALETRRQMRAAPASLCQKRHPSRGSYPRSTAPSGIRPVSRKRQSAIKSFRASATMSIFRMRLLPCPNRFTYHWGSALVG